MDTEPSSDQRRVRPWAQAHKWGRAHRGTVRSLLQVAVILVGALGLWLIGIGQQSDNPLPATPAGLSFVPSPTSGPTSVSPPTVPHETAFQPTERAAQSEPAVLTAVPDREALDSIGLEAPALVDDTPSADWISSTEDAVPGNVVPPEAGAQDQGKEDAGPPDEVPPEVGVQDAPVLAGGEALPLAPSGEAAPEWTAQGLSGTLPGVFTSILPTPAFSPTAPAVPETIDQWVWPVRGELSQGYSNGHRAIDISTEQGAVVVAADAGTVVYARWESSGFGYLVIIDHHNGFVSYYAHLYGFYIDVGYEVARGEQIGELGTTGRSTGPHLHFEIRQDGVQRDPLDLLP